MPAISGSQITNTSEASAAFTPSGLFVVLVDRGAISVQCRPPGRTVWNTLADERNGQMANVQHLEGTAVAITPDIAGTEYRLSPVGIATAVAWSA